VPRPDDQLLAALAQLSTIPFAGRSLPAVVHEVTDIAATVLDRPLEASVTLVHHDRGSTVAASGTLAVDLDEFQYRSDTGPCLEAARRGRPVTVVTARPQGPWADFAREAAGRGCHGVLSSPLPAQRTVLGSFNLYVGRDVHADLGRRGAAERFATHAATTVANMYAYEDTVKLAGNLRLALDLRPVIDQAKGILMERYKLTADQAFAALVRISNETNTKLRTIAQEIVHTGEVPLLRGAEDDTRLAGPRPDDLG
jgi:hypothetical protein